MQREGGICNPEGGRILMPYYSGSEERIKELRDPMMFPDPWDLLVGMISPKNRTNLQRETVLKIQELIEKEGFDVAHRVMASILGYGFIQIEKEHYRFGHFWLFRRMLRDRFIKGILHPPKLLGRYVDHYYGIKNRENGREHVILEPYGISFDDIKELVKQCDDNGLEFRIDGNSIHFAGWTIRIDISEKNKVRPKTEAVSSKKGGDL